MHRSNCVTAPQVYTQTTRANWIGPPAQRFQPYPPVRRNFPPFHITPFFVRGLLPRGKNSTPRTGYCNTDD